ncbi:MAG: sigma-E processing peptidase SpoIIGA [bacterium]|nr:sigma-E processing peptidase SpoIIGA [bacterium]
MKIYLDLVFLLNFFFDFILLYGTSKILKNVVRLGRLLLGSLVAATSVFLLFIELNSISLFLLKFGLSILIILVTFGKRGFLKNISYFYLVSIILGGSLYLLNISFNYENKGILFVNNGLSINFILMLIASPIILFCYVRQTIIYKNTYGNIYEVVIKIGKEKYKLKGMIDTGNQLVDPYRKRAVILVNNNINLLGHDFVFVPYKALNTTGIIKCYKPNLVMINGKSFNNCLIGVSRDEIKLNDIDCILPNKFKEDL